MGHPHLEIEPVDQLPGGEGAREVVLVPQDQQGDAVQRGFQQELLQLQQLVSRDVNTYGLLSS